MPRLNLPRLRPTVAPRPTIVPKKPDPLPTKPEVALKPKTTIAPKAPDPLPTKPKPTIITQSGNDWGTEDLDEYFGTDIMDMDPNSPEFAAAVQADIDAGPPTLPGEIDESGWSSDFTDSGEQTSYDPEDTDEEEGDAEIKVGGGRSIAAPGVNMGIRQLQDEGSKVSSGNLRRNIRKLSPSLISARA